MDFRKLFAYAGLIIIAWFLWNLWQREHVIQPTLPTNAVVSSPSSGTVPAIPSHAANPTPLATQPLPDPNRFVSVKTNTLEAKIDKQGGSLVDVKLLTYRQELKEPQPFQLLNNTPENFYVAQSGLTGEQGPDTPQGQAFYQSAQSNYVLQPDQEALKVELTWENAQGLHVTKEYLFKADSYAINLNYRIQNTGLQTQTVYPYAQLQRKEPPSNTSFLHYGLFTGAAISTPQNHYQKLSFSDLGASPVNQTADKGWIAMLQHYFLSAWVPPAGSSYHYYSGKTADNLFTVGVIGSALTIAPQQTATTGFEFYSGPAIADYLDKLAPHLSLTIDYGWLWFISAGLFWVMTHLHQLLGNWGISIILLTLLIKLAFFQLSAKSYHSMAHMRRLQPKMQQLKERFGEDRQKLSQAMMALYREEKVNPLSGCLPILIQIPFFIGLYYMIIESVELRHAPFFLWIQDLSAADPFYILPLIMGGLMFLQQRLNPPAPDPVQQKVMMFLPVIFTVFFLNFPSGLVLYWITNTALSILQQWFITRQVAKAKK